MSYQGRLVDFLRQAHIFASTVHEVLEQNCLRQTTTLDITLPQFNLIRLIATNGDHEVREIASFLGVSQAAASKNVDKLVRLGLVTRKVQPRDRRAVSLNVTGRGKNLIRKYETLKAQKVERVINDLTQEELHALTRGLEKVSCSIMEKERGVADICFKCSAYYSRSCLLRDLHYACAYIRDRKRLTK